MNKVSHETALMHSIDGTRTITVEEFDRLFDEGSDEIDAFINWQKMTRPNLEIKRVNVDFPQWVINALDIEAQRIGISRQALIKSWICEKLEERKSK